MLDGEQRSSGILSAVGDHVVKTLGYLVDQQKVNAFTLKLVVVVEALGIDHSDDGFAVFRDDCFQPPLTSSASSEKFARACDKGITSLAENAIRHSECCM